MERILLVTYYFPPDPSIGSRRWAKFAKYLKKKGYVVDVICVENSGQSSPWDQDIEGINIFKVPYRYFRILDGQPKNLFEKLFYRLTLFIVRLFSKGTVYDRALFLKKPYQKMMKKLMAENKYEAVIANGPPHRVMYYVMEMKKYFSDTVFVADFRDPWTWWYNLGYPFLKEKHKEAEGFMEAFVIDNADLITCPILEMKEKLIEKYPENESKIQILPHAFDDDDFKSIDNHKPLNGDQDRLKMVYFGAKYKAAESEWEKVIEFVKSQNELFQLDLFLTDFEQKSVPNDIPGINIKEPISSNKLFGSIVSYDFIILVYPKDFKDYFASKFYEMIRTKVPIVYFGYRGATSEFIESNGLGLFIDLDQIDKMDFDSWKSKISSFCYNVKMDISIYSFDSQADILIRLIEKLK